MIIQAFTNFHPFQAFSFQVSLRTRQISQQEFRFMNTRNFYVAAIGLFFLASLSVATAQQSPAAGANAESHDVDELAKKLSNPVAALISVPFQYNFARSYGDDGYQNLLNIQPVIPITLSDDWNLISRTILPIIQQKDVQPGKTQFGLGDVVQSFFFSPSKVGKSGLIWGAGPAALVPTGTDGIGANTWALGPTFVVLKQEGPWTYGALANQLWDTGGKANISSLFLQPFLAKSIGKGRTISINTETTYNWLNKEWSIPINVAYSKVSKIGNQLVSNQIGAKVFLKTPYGYGPDWGLRYTFTLMFPRG